MKNKNAEKETIEIINKSMRTLIFPALLAIGCVTIISVSLFSTSCTSRSTVKTNQDSLNATTATSARKIPADAWKAPDESTIPAGKEGDAIRYGKELIAHTGLYYGPQGSIAKISNGMNCQNCHLDGGTRYFGNNYGGFFSSYPKLSIRAGKVEPASERIVECFERSLGGKAPDTTSKDIKAMLAYMQWIGKDVKKGQKVIGAASEKLTFMNHAADPIAGKAIYMAKCQSCHGASGQGQFNSDKRSYLYPPVWGDHSYNDGAGMYRIINLAGFVKNNMPFGASYLDPQLTDEEAWNVAAFIDSQPRKHRDQHDDWKDLSKKPIDYPFGPYADNFSEQQHKFGPFGPVKAAQKQTKSNNKQQTI